MQKKKRKIPVTWWLAVLCFLLGLVLTFLYTSIQFTGWILLGIFGLLVIYWLLKRLSRRRPQVAKVLRQILTVCLCAGLLASAITLGFIYIGSVGDPDADCQYVIVLGCGVNGTVPSLSLQERINAAYDYLMAHPDAICIASGGQGRNEDITEAYCIFRELTAMGIDPERIWQEGNSTSTMENLSFTLALIEEKTGVWPEHLGIISSEYHLFRAGCMAQNFGLTSTGIPARTGWLTLRVNYFLREIAAVWYYFIGRIFV